MFTEAFEAAIPQLRREILDEFARQSSGAGFRSVWEHFEDVVNPVLINFLTGAPLYVPRSNIVEAKSKSVYPDLKVRFRGALYAVDVKSGEAHINPWYDIGRLDTYEEKHLDIYDEEYCVTVKWAGRPKAVVQDVFIEPTHCSVGIHRSSGGVLYRPYDGKLRPKSWADFNSGLCYWNSREEFIQGLYASRTYRQRAFIAQWYKDLSPKDRARVQHDLAQIDKGFMPDIEAIGDDDIEVG